MFHGLRDTKVAQDIMEHGFDTRVANQGLLGAGIYCAEYSCLADRFTTLGIDNLKCCFYGRFMLGITEHVTRNELAYPYSLNQQKLI